MFATRPCGCGGTGPFRFSRLKSESGGSPGCGLTPAGVGISTRDKAAALKFIKKAPMRHGRTGTMVTDGLRSYSAALVEIGAADRQEQGRWKNNRAEHSHLPFQRRERAMEPFRRMKTLQKLAAVHGTAHNHFA